jgi:hypothetical protein
MACENPVCRIKTGNIFSARGICYFGHFLTYVYSEYIIVVYQIIPIKKVYSDNDEDDYSFTVAPTSCFAVGSDWMFGVRLLHRSCYGDVTVFRIIYF